MPVYFLTSLFSNGSRASAAPATHPAVHARSMYRFKVAFVSIDDARDPQSWSGTPHSMLTHLESVGAPVEVISPLRRRFKYLFAPHKLAARMSSRSFQVDRQPLALSSYSRQISKRLRVGDVDVVFATSSIPIARLECRQPIVYWTDGVWDAMADYYAGAFSNPTKSTRRCARAQEEAALMRAAFAVYSSEWAAETAHAHYGVPRSKLRVIPFGPNMRVEHAPAEAARFIDARATGCCRLLFLGVEWGRKGGALALETARKLNQMGLRTTLTVAGCDPFPSGAPDFVEPLGFISKRTEEGQRKLAELLRSSHFLILPTRAEASAIVFCEASAFALPVLTTETGGAHLRARGRKWIPFPAGQRPRGIRR